MTARAVLEALGVGLTILLLAWTSLLYVPFRWRPVGRYLWFEKVAAGAFTPFIAASGNLHGAHDFRHTFSTWLEDAGIPARVIDELMGHQPSGRSGRHEASAIGAHYRHTTPEMAARVVAAVEERLVIVLATAEAALDQQPWPR
jgi:integrase